MLKNVTHAGPAREVEEILFATPFDYMFPEAARQDHCLLPAGQATTRALLALGSAMSDPGGMVLDSTIPSVFTYLGQFIDHDLTARTDRETATSEIFAPDGNALPVVPRDPDEIVTTLKNGRRLQLDLDSVYGDGPGLSAATTSNAAALYDNYKLRLQDGGHIDLARNGRAALIADGRNDENVVISQLHAAIHKFHNVVMDGLAAESNGTGALAYVRARQLVRWCYQYIVVEDYLKTVCDKIVVEDVLRNGPNAYGPVSGGLPLFMPLEFSVAAFRFGHSMIRPAYKLKGEPEAKIEQILGLSLAKRPPGQVDLLEQSGGGWRRKDSYSVLWPDFAGPKAANKARCFDTLIARGLGSLTFAGNGMPGHVITHLAQRNLLRGFSLSIPTGQAVAAGFGIQPISPADLMDGETPDMQMALQMGGLAERSPLWYYVLREAKLHAQGQHLGEVGSRIVAETIVGLLKADPNSYITQFRMASPIHKDGIEVPTTAGRKKIASIVDLLKAAGVY